ncbi:YhcN/YlaJ family sporulation lipoprotein [Neobacillus sp. K501]
MKKFFMIIGLILVLIGCNNTNTAQNDQKQNLINVKNSEIENVDRKTGQQVSKRLVELATSIPEVNDATAVVLGRYAIVGIDVNSKVDRSQVGSIKYSVAESLKNDPYGARAVVIADADTNQRLKEISADIQKGRPIRGIMEELADVAGRLMPEIPAKIIDPNPTKAPEEPKKQLNQQEEKTLDRKQEEESKEHMHKKPQ